MDLIDRQALLKQIDIDSDGEPGYYGDTWKFIDTIKNLPPATDINVATKVGTNLAEVGTDCISRQAAIDALESIGSLDTDADRDYARSIFNAVPSAQPEPPEECERCMMEHTDEMEKLEAELAMAQPKRGRWISADAIFGGVPFYCSECGENTRDTVMGKPRWNFCPNCGSYNGGEHDG